MDEGFLSALQVCIRAPQQTGVRGPGHVAKISKDESYFFVFATSAPAGTLSAATMRHSAPGGFANGPLSSV
jgi:hypothetical protein